MLAADPIPSVDFQPPRVSIVMPVFNADRFLEASIGSVITQTISDWELILVDDGSSDDSQRLCDEYSLKHSNITFIAQQNSGPSAARNAGVAIARGDYIFFLDADDRLPSDALQHLLAATRDREVDMVLGNFLKQENDQQPLLMPVIFAPDGAPFMGDMCELSGKALLNYVRHFLNYPSNHLVSYCWARLYRRAVILQHGLRADENMRLFEDFAFNLAFLGKSKRLVFVNQPVYEYILRSRHVSASMAILNASSLASDMQAFLGTINCFLSELSIPPEQALQVRHEARHTLAHYAIIFIIRTCRQLNSETKPRIIQELREFVSSTILRESLSCYTPRPGNSRLLPALMKLKLIRLLAVIAKIKGNSRYGKLSNRNT
ncbi:MAG: glycosyltransferase [Betaproteobacteria bacterium]